MDNYAVSTNSIQSALEAITGALGESAVLSAEAAGERYMTDPFRKRRGRPIAIVRPRSTEEVSKVLRIANDYGIPVVTQGGRTGLVGGCLPDDGELVLSLELMNSVETIDADAGTATVQAGVVLQEFQEQLEPFGLAFPLDLGSRGSCTIGGNISTNAGGNRVIRYGMTRDLVLGLEVVFADGTVLDGLKPFIKNNTGLDLKQLFIGSEGILGVVTRAVLRLIPKPAGCAVALCGLESFSQVRTLLRHLRVGLGGEHTAFEAMWRDYYVRAAQISGGEVPLRTGYPYYVLVEASGSAQPEFNARFERVLHEALEKDVIADAAIANSGAQAAKMWEMRDLAVEVDDTLAPMISFDVSLRISEMEQFVTDLEVVARNIDPRCDFVVFGHVGDGNLHMTMHSPPEIPDIHRLLTDGVYGLVKQYGGSVSAEHGIGILRLPYLQHSRTRAEIDVMRLLKCTLDPKNILNPGRVLDHA